MNMLDELVELASKEDLNLTAARLIDDNGIITLYSDHTPEEVRQFNERLCSADPVNTIGVLWFTNGSYAERMVDPTDSTAWWHIHERIPSPITRPEPGTD